MSAEREAEMDTWARAFVLRWYRTHRRQGMTPREAAREVWRGEAEAVARLALGGVRTEDTFELRVARHARELSRRVTVRRDVRGGFWLTGKVTVMPAALDPIRRG